jgi:hypothetical protein
VKSIPRKLMDVCCGDETDNKGVDINEEVMQQLLNSEI